MNDPTKEVFRLRLLKALEKLGKEDALGAEGQQIVQLDQQAVGRLSRMDALQNQAMAKATAARRATQRRRLHAALARLEDGEFGYWDDCGDPIPAARLDLDPCACKCVSCATG